MFLFSFFLSSCAGRINGVLHSDGSADLSLEISLEPRMTVLIRTLSSLSENAPQDGPAIDGPAIARSMAAAPGIEAVSLRNRTPSSIAGTIRISRIDQFLALPQKIAPVMPGASEAVASGRRFITYTPGVSPTPKGGGKLPAESTLQIHLDRTVAPQILALISEDVRDYLSILGAPAATGERLSRTEYLELVASFYGKALAEEIAAAGIIVFISFPGPVSAVKGGTISGTQVRFDIPLADLLVLEAPLEYEVVWK